MHFYLQTYMPRVFLVFVHLLLIPLGEDALANVSIEKQVDGKIGGFIRIRSKTQGIALSLGDKITMKQRIAQNGKTSV